MGKCGGGEGGEGRINQRSLNMKHCIEQPLWTFYYFGVQVTLTTLLATDHQRVTALFGRAGRVVK